MAKQKTFWGVYPGRVVRHLWKSSPFSTNHWSVCGMMHRHAKATSDGEKCKRCLTAIDT